MIGEDPYTGQGAYNNAEQYEVELINDHIRILQSEIDKLKTYIPSAEYGRATAAAITCNAELNSIYHALKKLQKWKRQASQNSQHNRGF